MRLSGGVEGMAARRTMDERVAPPHESFEHRAHTLCSSPRTLATPSSLAVQFYVP